MDVNKINDKTYIAMLTPEDQKQLAQKGISEEKFNKQLEDFKTGFPFLRLEAAASVSHGIVSPSQEECDNYIAAWNQYKGKGHKVVKFVPASGAASRMFKNMFAFLQADYDEPQTDFEKKFFDDIKKFAFREELCKKCRDNNGKNIKTLLAEKQYKTIVANMLNPEGLN